MITGREYEWVTQTQIFVRLPDKNPSPLCCYIFPDASRVKLNTSTSSQERFLQWKKKNGTWDMKYSKCWCNKYELWIEFSGRALRDQVMTQSNTEEWTMMALPCYNHPCTFVIVHVAATIARVYRSLWNVIQTALCLFSLVLETCLSF